MSEMLANQFFMIRDYAGAARTLEIFLKDHPQNKAARRKIIVCYSQTGEVEKAMDCFHSLIREDVDFIIKTDPELDDCPCPEIVDEMEKGLAQQIPSRDTYLILGMLWLYCDIAKSIYYFRLAHNMDRHHKTANSILAIITSRYRQLYGNSIANDLTGRPA